MSASIKRLKDSLSNVIYPQTKVNAVYDDDNTRLDTLLQHSRVPIGTIQEYGGTTIPSGWLECNGSAVNRTVYAQLFSVIGTTYGSGDGSTTFNLPKYEDMEQRKLLWTNPSPMSEFSAQTISLDLTNFDSIIVDYAFATNYVNLYTVSGMATEKDVQYTHIIHNDSGGKVVNARECKFTNSGVQFRDAQQFTGASNSNTNNICTIPVKIWGIQKASGVSTKHIIKANNNSISEPVSPTIEQRIAVLEARKPTMEYVGTVTMPYTATEDASILIAYVNPPSAGESTLYIQASDNTQTFANFSIAMGYSVYVPCVKGLTYRVSYSNNVGTPTYRLYRITN